MKKSKFLAMFLVVVMMVALSSQAAFAAVEDSEFFGPIYDEWSDLTSGAR